jgi:hypothetical protein
MTETTDLAAPPEHRPAAEPPQAKHDEFGSVSDGWGSMRVWSLQTSDDLAAITSPNYFCSPPARDMAAGDLVLAVLYDDQGGFELHFLLVIARDPADALKTPNRILVRELCPGGKS